MARKGLNGTLSYAIGKSRYEFSIRVGQINHGVRMVAEESAARQRRAYYPHRVSAPPFTLTVIVKGLAERTAFSNYLYDYANRVLDPTLSGSFPEMTVTCAVRSFSRNGVPLSGIEWGTNVGAMMWTPQVTFETTYDKSAGDSRSPATSKFVLTKTATKEAPELKYFYPAGVQLSGSQVPPAGDYTQQLTTDDISKIMNGGTPGGSDSGEAPPPPGGGGHYPVPLG